jgi:predicted dehydrogenase
MDSVGFGVVGLGAFGLRYVEALSAQPDATVVWGCDLSPERHAAAVTAGALSVTDELDRLLEDPRVDAVVVATPEAGHRSVAVRAMEAGKHVVVEKPLATEREDAAAMVAVSERLGVMLMPAFLLRFDYRYAQLKARIGEIGPIRNIYAYRNFDRGLFGLYHRSHSFVENAIHDLDLILWLTGADVVAAHGYCRNTGDWSNPDVNWGILELDNNALAVVQTSWLYPAQEHRDLQWNAGIQVMGDRGVLEVSNDGGGFRANTEGAGILLLDQTGWADIHGEPRGAFGAMLRHVTGCISGRLTYAGTTPREALRSMEIAQMLIADSAG